MEYIVIDTESCTGKSDDGSLCSVGYAVADDKLNIIKRDDIILNPLPKRFSVGDKKNLKRTGVMFAYTVEQFRNAPDFKDKYEEIKDLFTGRTVLGFAMANDVKYINDACDKFNLPRIEYAYMDVQFLYKLSNPEANSIGLKTLAEKYGITYMEHRSDEDAVVSLLVLKKMLEENNRTFNEYLTEYEVKFGKNTKNGYHHPYSLVEFRNEKGLKVSRRLQGFIYSDYLHRLPKRLKGNVYCFAYDIEKKDVSLLRTLIDEIYLKGNSFTRDADVCNVYVKCGNEESDQRLTLLKTTSKRLKRVISLEDLFAELDINEVKRYDDSLFLAEFSEKLIK